MSTGYQFDEESVRRIERAVQRIEQLPLGAAPPANLNLGPLPPSELIPFTCTEAVPAGGILVDNGATIDPDDGMVILTARKSQTTGERPIWVSLPEAVAANEVGSCLAPRAGIPIRVAYDTADGTPAAGETWGPVKDSFKLRKGLSGFKCLVAGADGLVWAVYDGVGEPSVYGKLNATLSPGGSAAFSIYRLSGGTWIDTSLDETVYAPPTFTVGTIASAKWVRPKWTSQSRRLEVPGAAEC